MGKRIEGFWLTRWFAEMPREKIAETVQAVQTRFIKGTWSTQVSETLSLEEALNGLPRALSGTGKMFIAPGPGLAGYASVCGQVRRPSTSTMSYSPGFC